MSTSKARRRCKANAKQVILHWDNPDYLDQSTLQNLLKKLSRECDTPFSLAISLLLEAGTETDHIEMFRICDELQPKNYLTAVAFRRDNLLRNLLAYNPCLPTGLDLDKEAMKKFIAGETSCRRTNGKIFAKQHEADPDVRSVLFYARNWLAKTLSDLPDITLAHTKFGPGSSYSITKNTSALDKLSGTLECTERSIDTVLSYLHSNPGWWRRHFDVQPSRERLLETLSVIPGDRSECVPKNALSNRLINIGPLLNVTIQKMYGSSIRKDLRKAGLDLKTCQAKHRYLAQKASITGESATVDVKNASGTICTALYFDLLPPLIFDQLDAVRSTKYRFDETFYQYEMFSGMGNGFTFELETLLFYAIALSVMKHKEVKGTCSVYGDDIILPVSCTDLLEKVFSAIGLTVNNKKTFTDGPFRESCGGDYFLGVDVNTFKLREQLTPRIIVLMHNRWLQDGDNYLCPKTFSWLRKILHKDLLRIVVGPSNGGDGHFHDYRWPEGKPFSSVTCVTEFVTNRKPDLTCYSLESFALYRVTQTRRYSKTRSFVKSKIRNIETSLAKWLVDLTREFSKSYDIGTEYQGEPSNRFFRKHGFNKYKLSSGLITQTRTRAERNAMLYVRDTYQHTD